jgi:alkylation response protein AidB-like acyl-CoA dehydrogenase
MVAFTEEHQAFRKSVRGFVEREIDPYVDAWERDGQMPTHELFAQLGALGYLGLEYDPAYGGGGADHLFSVVLAEEIGRCDAAGVGMAIAVQTDMATPSLHRFGSEELKQRYLAPAIRGEMVAAIAVTEPDAGSDVAGIKTRAVRDGDEYVINGSKTYITNGHRAHVIVLVTKTDPDAGYDGFTLFLVPMDAPGVIREKKLEKLGMHASDTALLAFQDVRVPETAVLGQVGKGFYHIMWELQGERLIGAAGCVAGAQRVFDQTLKYANERTAFGRQIGKFQVNRHKFAEMATKIEAARQLTYTTAWRFQNGEYPVREISMAKLYAARIAVEVADECIQLHGGAGYMKEYGVERVWRDMRLNRIGAGTDEIMLDVIGRSYGL